QAYQHRITRLTRGSTLSPGAICAHAYPDRIGQLRDNKNLTYKLSGGGAASFHSPNQLSNEDYLVITELDGRERSAKIFSAVAITLTEIETLFADQLSNETRVSWNKQQTAIIAEKITTFKTLVLRQAPILKISDDTLLPLMLIAIRQHGLSCFMWDKKSTQWLNRVRFLNRHEKEHSTLPDFSETALLESLESWLAPWIQGFKKLSQLKSLNIKSLLMSRLDWTQQQWIHAQAPTHFQVPSGSRIALTYEENQPPVLAVRIQEMFSCTTTPTIADGKAPLLLHLLSPGQRPVQVTQDLISFWSNSYLEVKKELKGRYPKHHWPDDPLNTQPHATVKPRNKS
ncbi:MAG TPA: ATP-dependent helicase HrpB, partial [Gammaproteobacteria bacterium]|nr:ATP-dependent helicase HrpB [Gammaproteobacteria bacterium]